KTLVTIAHRLSTSIHADQIIVMKEGRIAEKGKHEDLLAEGGLYAALWKNQAKADVKPNCAHT
ncbi:hypothetical protein CAPTEDRAFT_117527, partial [Capitella teleta]